MQDFVPIQKKIFDSYKCSYSFTLVNIGLIPVYLGFFLGIRDICTKPEVLNIEYCSSNFFWIDSIFSADPYFIIPLTSTLLGYMSLKKATSNKHDDLMPDHPFNSIKKYIPMIPLFAFPLIASFPAGINIYFTMLSMINFGWIHLLSNKNFRQSVVSSYVKEPENQDIETDAVTDAMTNAKTNAKTDAKIEAKTETKTEVNDK
mgnify:CR=1 FL=1